MTDRKIGNTPTVQGRETPVPVENGGGQAGPTRPSSNNREEQEQKQDQQGEGQGACGELAPGWMGAFVFDPFKRRDSIGRSPPRARKGSRSSPITVSGSDQKEDERDGRDGTPSMLDSSPEDVIGRGKRKRRRGGTKGNTPDMDGEMEYVAAMLKNVSTAITGLHKLTVENTNTKKEIKEVASRLRGYAEKLTSRRIQEFLAKAVENAQDRDQDIPGESLCPNTISMGTQTEDDAPLTSITSIGVQVCLDEEEKIISAEVLKQRIEDANEDNDFKELLAIDWPEEGYRHTKVVEGNPLLMKREYDLAVCILDSETGMEKGLHRQFAERYSELLDMEDEDIGCISQTLKITKEGEIKQIENYIYKLRLRQMEDTDIIKLFIRLDESMSNNRREKVAMPGITNIETTKLRKLIELALRNSKTSIRICVPKLPKKVGPKPTVPTKETRERGTNAILIRKNGAEYASILKQVKEEIKATHLTVGINSIRETRNGDLLLTVDKNETKLTNLRNIMAKKMGQKNVSIKDAGNMKVLHIRGIDAVTSKEEVRESAAAAAGLGSTNIDLIEVSNMRPTFGSCQIATIKTTNKLADTLIRKDRILIGATRCKVILRQELRKCYKCWGYDHLAADCNGPDRTKACVKCAESGHQAKECNNDSYCPICDKAGHRAGNAGCPKYRQALAK